MYIYTNIYAYIYVRLTGYLLIAVGVMLVGAYGYLLYMVLTNRPYRLPKGAVMFVCRLCCYGPLVYGCIENYQKELVPEEERYSWQLGATWGME